MSSSPEIAYTAQESQEAKIINHGINQRYAPRKKLELQKVGPTSPALKYQQSIQQRLLKGNPSLKQDVEELQRNGYIIFKDALNANDAELARLSKTSEDLLSASPSFGRNAFEGLKTKRLSGLVGKSRVYDKVLMNERVENIASYFLFPNYLLSIAQLSQIFPGSKRQPLHRDSGRYSFLAESALPRAHPLQISVVWAITDFTAENGATLVIPGSQRWDAQRRVQAKDKVVPIEMKAGSCVVFLGTLLHGGGANEGRTPRIGLVMNFVQPWLRTQENHFLAVPFDVVPSIPKKIQKWMGYSIHPPNYGMANEVHPLKSLPKLLARFSKL